MMKKVLTIAGAILMATPCRAVEDHLTPDTSAFVDPSGAASELDFVKPFSAILNGDEEAWVIAGEGLTPPFLVGVKHHAGSQFLFGAKVNFVPGSNGKLDKIQPCELRIDETKAMKIVRLWRTMLMQTRFDPNPSVGLDGETYHFAMRDGYNWMSGRAWTPQTPKLASFVNIVESMRTICEEQKARHLPRLEMGIDDLLMRR